MAVRFRAVVVCLLAFGLAGWLAVPAAGAPIAQTPARLEIETIDTTRFPETAVTFRVIDSDGRPIPGLTDFQLLENDQPVVAAGLPVETEQPATVSLLLLIDQGLLSIVRYRERYETAALKSLLQLLGDTYLREGDTVCLAVGRFDTDTGGRQQMSFPQACADYSPAFGQAIAALDIDLAGRFPGRRPSEIRDVEHTLLFHDALDALDGRVNPVIVFFSAYISPLPWGQAVDPGKNRYQMAAEQMAREAADSDVRVFVLQAAGNTLAGNVAELQTPMVTLAENSGGQYVELREDLDNLDGARAAFDDIRPLDYTYTLTYRSPRGNAGERRIKVFPDGRPELSDERAVALDLLPPEAGEVKMDDSQTLAVPISWPDGFARRISAVTLNGEPLAGAAYTYDDASGTLRLTLDEGMTGDLRFTVVDELGLVSVEFVHQIATPVPPTATPAPATATPVPEPVAPPEPPSSLPPWIGLGALAALAALAAGLFVAARRGALAGLSQKPDGGAPRVKTIGTARDQKQALAYLLVLTGREDLIGQNIPLYNEITTIGRDPQLTDIQLYHPHELSSISGQHCTIQVDHGLFLIIDNNSANGTFVNGTALMPDMPHQLQDADEIVLGDKLQRGAQLRFEVSQGARNRYYETVIEANWQGDRSGTETVTGPPRPAGSWMDTSALVPDDSVRAVWPDSTPADDPDKPPADNSAA